MLQAQQLEGVCTQLEEEVAAASSHVKLLQQQVAAAGDLQGELQRAHEASGTLQQQLRALRGECTRSLSSQVGRRRSVLAHAVCGHCLRLHVLCGCLLNAQPLLVAQARGGWNSCCLRQVFSARLPGLLC